MRHVALELVFKNKESLLISFETERIRDEVYTKLHQQSSLKANAAPSLREMTEKWVSKEIDNYEYLTFLNQQAGRSRNDVTQYPVFPWIIKEWDEYELDLDDPSIYRDLSKPMGAQNPSRLEKFRIRYEEMPEEVEGGKFMYGTHYSTPGYVIYFIVRSQPQLMLRLQNGKFDSPDRMFFSIERTWTSALNSHSDVKELIPEFFEEASDFLNNSGHDFGVRQNGEPVDDVELPNWAMDADEFLEKVTLSFFLRFHFSTQVVKR
jgi:factor associated with neutral sphingomyelinase activation